MLGVLAIVLYSRCPGGGSECAITRATRPAARTAVNQAGLSSTSACATARLTISRSLFSRRTGAVAIDSAYVRGPVTPLAESVIDKGHGAPHQRRLAAVAAGVPAVKTIVRAAARIIGYLLDADTRTASHPQLKCA